MEDVLTARIRAALAALPDLPEGFDAQAVTVEWAAPKDPAHGDLATNVALQLARPLSRPPRAIAEALAHGFGTADGRVASVEVAGPGFLNVRLSDAYVAQGLAAVLAAGDAWGRTQDHAGETAIVEYVSANPTGPLTVGHGRNAVLGDTFANLLAWTGYDVAREYYFNDAGRQMRMLGQSVHARLHALLDPAWPTRTLPDGTAVPEGFPDDGYLGAYIGEIASSILTDDPVALAQIQNAETEATAVQVCTDAATVHIFAEIDQTLKRLHIEMDNHFNESDLYADGRRRLLDTVAPSVTVGDVLDRLAEAGLLYEKDGAQWFRTSALGKTTTDAEGVEHGQDTVLVKSSGEPTYRLPDIAYHMDKLARGFDLVLDVFGADHIATYPDVLRGVTALGGDASKIQVVVYQFVTLVRNGQPVKMSTRKATYVTLDDLMDEVGEDVTRFFFLMRSPNTHLEFDLALATEASEKNPVFYLQYAHARIASIRRKAAVAGLSAGRDLALLTHPSETALAKTLLTLPDEVRAAAEGFAPHRLAEYLRTVAGAFSLFYRDCRIVGEAPDLAGARLALAHAAQTTLANGLAILGISAPDRMDRAEPEAGA